ncbi:LysE family translocator [Rhodospirillum centenum]|uniref:Translocator protein, LysE family protein n=1 Tax=Rhodospirillum centenum (strain ATCC 51521 / SW) TaxID=414684 RepID=B6INT2_RHOCS|nr:LysE family translocator [Rhodospirillum centenum]ACI99266.1 translocator protein, LysE family protein [Rhodospirillum centenum SW]
MPVFDPQLLAVYTLAAVALSLTPGPDMLLCFASGLGGGPRAGLAASAGVATALLLHTVAMTLGFAGLVAASPLALDLLRWLGAAYLLWAAWNAFRAGPAGLGAVAPTDQRAALAAVYRRGLLTCLLNPKLLLFMLAFLPQFVRPEAGSMAAQFLVLSLILFVPGFLVNAAVGVSAGGLGRWLLRRPLWARVQNWLVGTIFVALALRLVAAPRG